MTPTAAEPIATAIGPVEISLAVLAEGNNALCSYYERAGFVRRVDVEVDGRADATVPETTGRFIARQYEKSLA